MRISRKKFIWLSLLICLWTACSVPVAVIAQAEKTDLSLRLLPGDYYNQIKPGVSTTLFLEVKNNGTSTLTNIRFSSTQPEGWTLIFQPATLNTLTAGSSQTVDAILIPAERAGRGNYNVTLLAESNQTRTATTAFLRIEQSSNFWIWVGAGIALLVVLAFVYIFLRFGKQ